MTDDGTADRSPSPIGQFGLRPVRRDDDSLFITIPDDQAELFGISDGDYVDVLIQAVYRRHSMDPQLHAVFERVWQKNEAGFRYLVDHD